jgi:nucleotide-binding universal stress UspA family protein
MSDTTTPVIVVGVDGSDTAKNALEFAIEEARLRHATLQITYAYPVIDRPVSGSTGKDYYEQVEVDAKAFIQSMMKSAPSTDGVEVEWLGVPGNPAEVLIEASRAATILVVGSRGVGGFRGLLVGSVSNQCVHHSYCPVLVVRESH